MHVFNHCFKVKYEFARVNWTIEVNFSAVGQCERFDVDVTGRPFAYQNRESLRRFFAAAISRKNTLGANVTLCYVVL